MNKASQMLLIYQAKQIAPGIVAGCFALALVFCFYLFAPLLAAFDEQGKPAQHGVGTVTSIISRSLTRGNTDPAALVGIEVGNRTTLINSHSSFFVGQKLSVDYKIGRGGTLYVDRFKPISDAKLK